MEGFEMLKLIRTLLRNRKGAALVEYSLIVAGVALIAAASVATFGHKTNDMLAMVAAVLPGAHADDNAPIVSGKIIETANTGGPGGDAISLDVATIVANSGTERLGNNLGTADPVSALVVEP
jgi:Flp pilus assembly pilin Flp